MILSRLERLLSAVELDLPSVRRLLINNKRYSLYNKAMSLGYATNYNKLVGVVSVPIYPYAIAPLLTISPSRYLNLRTIPRIFALNVVVAYYLRFAL